MRKRNLPNSAAPSDNEEEVHQKKQLKGETPKKTLSVAEQRLKAKEWAEKNMSPAKATLPAKAPSSTSKAGKTPSKDLSTEAQRKRAEEWAVANGLLLSTGKKRIAEEEPSEEKEEEGPVEEPTPRKRNVRRKTISSPKPVEKETVEMDVDEAEEEEKDTKKRSQTPRLKRQQTKATEKSEEETVSTLSRSSSRVASRLNSERSEVKTPSATPSVRADSVTSTRRRKSVNPPKPTQTPEIVEERPSTSSSWTPAPKEVRKISPQKSSQIVTPDLKRDSAPLLNVDHRPESDGAKSVTIVEEESAKQEITREQTRTVLLLGLVAQILVILLFVLYLTNNLTGGILVVIATLAIAAVRRVAGHWFDATTDATQNE